jgi:hypothetical protein
MTPSLRRLLVAFACLAGPLTVPSYAQFPHCAGPSPDVEPNDTTATASPLNRAPQSPWHVVPSNGTIDPAGDVDHFRLDLSAGQRLWILADTAVPPIGSRDSFVRVIAPDGSVLAENDNDGTAFDLSTGTVVGQDAAAIAALQVPATGTYVIRVSAANPADRMSYRLYTAVSSNPPEAEIEPNDAGPVQPIGFQETLVLGQISPGDVDNFWGGVLGNGPRMVLVQGAVDVALPTDPVLNFFSFPSVTVDSSGLGGAEAMMLPEGGSPVRITAPAGLAEMRPYLYGLFYIGDACGLPVTLQSFAVE